MGCLFQVVCPPGVAAGRGARAAALRSPRLEQEVSLYCCKPFLPYSRHPACSFRVESWKVLPMSTLTVGDVLFNTGFLDIDSVVLGMVSFVRVIILSLRQGT